MHSQQIQAEVTRAVLNTLRQDTAFNRKHRPRPGAARWVWLAQMLGCL